MPTFKKFFNEYDTIKSEPIESEKKLTEEAIFEDIVGANVPSVDSFIAWLSLNEHINTNIKYRKQRKPVSLFKLPTDRKILHLVKKLPNIRVLAKEFTEKWQK
jgi:hypothetical protein